MKSSVRIVCFALAGVLLVASAVGLWRSFSPPSEVEAPTASYEHKGNFDYAVYLKPSTLYGDMVKTEIEEETGGAEEEEEQPPLIFFREITDKVRLAFSYNFKCSEPIARITNEVKINIIAENPGMWQKEMTALEETRRGNDFRVDFPLLLGSLENTVDDIEKEIGVTSSQKNFIIRAIVHTTAVTSSGKIIEDDFSHEITAILKDKTLELKGDLKGSGEGAWEGIEYEEKGWFDYEVYLKFNRLYGATVLRSEELPVAEPEPPPSSPSAPPTILGPGLIYFPNLIDSIEASFSYQFACDKPVSQQSEEVEISAIIENPDKWSKKLVLVPETRKEGNCNVSFPIDISYFREMIDAIQKETGAGGGKYNFKIKADVHTIAETDLGTVDDVYTQTLDMNLEGNILTFGEELSQSMSGSIGETAAPQDSTGGDWKTPWLVGLVVALIALGFLGWKQTRLKPLGIEAEAARAKKKYKQVIVDIEDLPEVKPNETVIPLGSLDALVKIADDLVKPVLHKAEEGRHFYCTIDGAVRYQYIMSASPERE